MDLCEVQETIRKHVTIIKKTIIKPLSFDIILKIPKKDMAENEDQKQDGDKKAGTQSNEDDAVQQRQKSASRITQKSQQHRKKDQQQEAEIGALKKGL